MGSRWGLGVQGPLWSKRGEGALGTQRPFRRGSAARRGGAAGAAGFVRLLGR